MMSDCLPLKIRGIKKAIWDKKFKNSRRNFKSPKRLNLSPEAPKKRIHRNAQKLKFLRKKLNTESLQIQIENLFKT
jgi:hypothetical protein